MFTLTLIDEIVAVFETSKPTHHSFDPLWIVRTTLEEVVVDPVTEVVVDPVTEAVVAVEVEEVVDAVPEANNDVSKNSKFSFHYFLSSPSNPPPLPGLYLQHETVGTVDDMRPAELEA